MAERGYSARLINEPVQSYGDAMGRAYEVIRNFLQVRQPDFTAVMAVTVPAAIGAMRAMHDVNIRIGKDVSVCAVADAGIGAYLYPTLTATRMPDPKPYLEVAFEWMLSKKENWDAPMLLQPSAVDLRTGESTGPCPGA
jgi:DNA-binding LacI/PurR family transcriptional regulator